MPAHAVNDATPLWLCDEKTLPAWLTSQPEPIRAWCREAGFAARDGQTLVVRSGQGSPVLAVAAATRPVRDPWSVAALPTQLAPGCYRLAEQYEPAEATQIALGWALGKHRPTDEVAALLMPAQADQPYVMACARVLNRARELIDTPPNLLGPDELSAEAADLAARHEAKINVVRGPALADANYPLIWAVGRASERTPCLIDVSWGDEHAPKVTLVGKGVCFDAGGLNIKSTPQLALMKKDMAGAACALALADLVMQLCLPVRLRFLIPAVDNAVSERSCRPSDVVTARNGLRVEIQNTDAEGRLILGDALSEAASERPDLLIDFGTLTYGATAALGPRIAAAYGLDETLLERLKDCGRATCDPVWPMPWDDAEAHRLESRVADVASDSDSSLAAPILAALFLRHFIAAAPRWIHLDFFGWNLRSRPGRPEGGEAQCVRALYRLLEERYRRRV